MDISFEYKSLYDGRVGGAAYSAGIVLLLAASFILSVVLSFFPSFSEDDAYIYISYLLPVICYMLPVVYFIKKTKTPVKTVYMGCKWYYFVLAVLMQFGLLSLSGVNELFIDFLRGLGLKVSSSASLPSLGGFGIVGVILAVAVLPAVCEETLFRGILLRSLEKSGGISAIFICGALFSLFHQSPSQTIYQFICGCAFALVAIRSGSILPTVVSHFLNNALIIILMKAGYENISFNAPMYVLSASALVLSVILLIFIKGGKGNEQGKYIKTESKAGRKEFFLFALPGIVICAVMWVAGLF